MGSNRAGDCRVDCRCDAGGMAGMQVAVGYSLLDNNRIDGSAYCTRERDGAGAHEGFIHPIQGAIAGPLIQQEILPYHEAHIDDADSVYWQPEGGFTRHRFKGPGIRRYCSDAVFMQPGEDLEAGSWFISVYVSVP